MDSLNTKIISALRFFHHSESTYICFQLHFFILHRDYETRNFDMGQALLKISPAQERRVTTHMHPVKKGFVEITKSAPASDMTDIGHFTLSVLFYTLLIAYLALVVITFVTAKPVVTQSIVPSEELAPIRFRVTPVCQSGGGCGAISVTANYTGMFSPERTTQCGGALQQFTNIPSGSPIDLTLCYIPDPVYSPTITGPLRTNGVYISCPGIVPEVGSATLTFEHPESGYTKFLTVTSGMVKSFNIGIQTQVQDETLVGIRPFSKNYQMEGLRLDDISDVILQLAPFTNKETVETKKSFITFMADFGSAFELVKTLFVIVIPLWALLFAKTAAESAV